MTLVAVSKRFYELLQASSDGVLNLNKVAEMLHIKKRRLYDIANVLEGIGLITRASTNHIQWR